jgi:hypothetical protein
MADYSIDVRNSGTVDVDSDVHLDGLDDIKVDSTLNAATRLNSESDVTLRSDGTARLTLDPVATTSSIGMDLEPVAVDSCVRVELAPVAPTMVRSPWEQRVGFSIWGIELAAVSWCGESTTYVEPVPPRPLVVGPTRTRPRPDRDLRHHRPDGGVEIRVGS